MAESPFRERRISPQETKRIVARAVALGALEAPAKTDAPALTEAELAQRLGELGLSDDAIRAAMTSSPSDVGVPTDRALRVVHEDVVDGMVPPESHEALADAMSAAMGSRGRVEVVGNKVTWTPGGMLLEPALTVRSKEGRTHLRVEETVAHRAQIAVGSIAIAFFTFLFALAPGIGIARAVGAASGSGLAVAVAVGFIFPWILGSIVLVRKLFARRYRTRTRNLAVALQNVEAVVRGLVVVPEAEHAARPVAVATAGDDIVADVAAAEAEAEAEDAEAAAARRAITER